jgi:hypothetical protein
VEGDDGAGPPDDGVGVDGEVVAGVEVFEEGVAGGIGGEGVAEAAIAGALEDGVEDLGRGGEVHIGDPEGDDVLAGVFAGFGGVWVWGRSLVEVVGHGEYRAMGEGCC